MFASAEGVVDDDGVLDDGVLVVSFLEDDISRARYFRTIFDVDESGVIDVDIGLLLEEAGVLVVSFFDDDILRAGYFCMMFDDDELVEVATCVASSSISGRTR
jgi:hypothetical protein